MGSNVPPNRQTRCPSDFGSGMERVRVESGARSACNLLFGGAAGELVTAIVIFVEGVALGPLPLRLMLVDEPVELHPEILIIHRLLIGLAPVVPFPAVNPLRDAVLHVFGVGDDFNRALFLEPPKALDRGGKFHAIVGRMRATAVHLFLDFAEAQNAGPAAAPRIALAGAVCNQSNLLQATSSRAGSSSAVKKESTMSRICGTSVAR